MHSTELSLPGYVTPQHYFLPPSPLLLLPPSLFGMGLLNLPSELLLHIVTYLDNRDLSAFSLSSRLAHWRLFYPLFNRTLAQGKCLASLFFHAVKHDSINIAQLLNNSGDEINLKGYEPSLSNCSFDRAIS